MRTTLFLKPPLTCGLSVLTSFLPLKNLSDISEYQFNQKFKGKAEKMFMCNSGIVKSILILWSNLFKTDTLGPAISVRLRVMSVKHRK